jgi:oxygen-independent coproporphyrinogen-3 oxidase
VIVMSQFSLYLHLPYCPSKCPYCDFNSYAATQWPEAEYTSALIAELRHYATLPPWRGEVGTIFFGGGTPSLFRPESIAAVLRAVESLWPSPQWQAAISPEVTLEANPGTVTIEKLRGFREAGVNRVSFGVQSFHPAHLKTLGRVHDEHEAVAALEFARAAGFDDLNLDLIFAIPEQTPEQWERDLQTAISLGPDHLSAYNLTFEEGTAFHAQRAKGLLRPAAEEFEVAMFTRAQHILGAAGYEHYEISNYARSGRICRHNLNYWRGGSYLGVGAGAHSFAIEPEPGVRWNNERSPAVYLQKIAAHRQARVSEETLTSSQARGEFVFLNLRVRDGFEGLTFERRFGCGFLGAFPHAASLERDGLLLHDGDSWRLSERGLLLADSVFATFL